MHKSQTPMRHISRHLASAIQYRAGELITLEARLHRYRSLGRNQVPRGLLAALAAPEDHRLEAHSVMFVYRIYRILQCRKMI